jgi:2,5-diamino-6-(ribosylamino)-4(3H)-pyrimidinone 5'-phosphate reductase
VRPQVIINCAASIDGKLALTTRTQTRLSSDADLARARRLRGEVDAVLVGVGTVLADDPGLLAPPGAAKQPLRVVVDSRGRTPRHAHVLDGKAKSLIATTEGCNATFGNAEVVRAGRTRVDLRALLEHLSGLGVKTLLVEGGGEIIHSFINAGLADDLFVFVADLVIGGRNAPTIADGEGARAIEDAPRARFVSAERLDGGLLLHYRFGRAD